MADNKRKKFKNCSKRHIRRIKNEFCIRFDNEHYSDTSTAEDDIIKASESPSITVYPVAALGAQIKRYKNQ